VRWFGASFLPGRPFPPFLLVFVLGIQARRACEQQHDGCDPNRRNRGSSSAKHIHRILHFLPRSFWKGANNRCATVARNDDTHGTRLPIDREASAKGLVTQTYTVSRLGHKRAFPEIDRFWRRARFKCY
jgi:hypothetical protein